MRSRIIEELQQSADLAQSLTEDDLFISNIKKIVELAKTVLNSDGKILLAGNGGSAADCQHIAGELVSRFNFDRPGVAAIALTTDTSIITAIGNDYGFDNLFSRQVQALGNRGDMLLSYTTSGRSPNIRAALDTARALGLYTVVLTGNAKSIHADECDIILEVPDDRTPKIQEAHLIAGHLICNLIEQSLFGEIRS